MECRTCSGHSALPHDLHAGVDGWVKCVNLECLCRRRSSKHRVDQSPHDAKNLCVYIRHV